MEGGGERAAAAGLGGSQGEEGHGRRARWEGPGRGASKRRWRETNDRRQRIARGYDGWRREGLPPFLPPPHPPEEELGMASSRDSTSESLNLTVKDCTKTAMAFL